MITGRDALERIDQAMTGMRRDEARMSDMLRGLTEQATRLRAEEAEAFRALARIRLDTLQSEAVAAPLDRAEREALAVIARAAADAEALKARRIEAEERLTQWQDARRRTAEKVEAAIDALDVRRASVEARLKDDPEWQRDAEALARAEAIAEEADRKADQAEANLAEKRKPYESDPLFMYLWVRRFGTSAYGTTGLTRFLDRWVAGLVGYDRARPDFVMLQEIPERLRAHASRCLTIAAEARTRLEARERAALEAEGAGALEIVLAEERDALKEADAALAKAEQAIRTIDARLASYANGGAEAAEAEAVAALARSLGHADLGQLREAALKTPTPEDERIVARIAELDASIARTEKELEDTRATAREIARRRTELEAARDEFRRSGYDRPYARFTNEALIASVIGGVVGGMLSGRDLGRALKDGFRQAALRSDPRFGGGPWGSSGSILGEIIGAAARMGDDDDDDDDDDDRRHRRHRQRRFPSGGAHFGGGFGGGGFRTGGRVGGGGFRTGGKF